jgi:ubiquinone/menaquinone biosynthesis C-methylase UbiE
MKRASEANINTVEYWDGCYLREEASGKARIDDARLHELLRWIRIREHELDRRASILDVGCGLGDLTKFLLPHNPELYITGIDISPEAIEHCNRIYSGKNAVFKVASAEAIPEADESHDIVWIGETLEHCENPDVAITEARRVCGEHGLIVLSTPYRGRNRSPEHVWEFDPVDIYRWGQHCGDLLFLDCALLRGFLTMFAVIRRAVRTEPS